MTQDPNNGQKARRLIPIAPYGDTILLQIKNERHVKANFVAVPSNFESVLQQAKAHKSALNNPSLYIIKIERLG